MNNKKRYMRKGWILGFLGLMSFMGLRYFQTGEWWDLVWFAYVLWFIWFIPVRSE